MNIILASDTYLPVISGVSYTIDHLTKELSKRNNQILLVCMGTKMKLTYTKKNKIKILRLPSVTNPIRIDHHIPMPLSKKITKFVNRFEPEVIHLHTPGLIGLWFLNYAKKHSKFLAATCHSIPEYLTSYFDFLPYELKRSSKKILWQYYRWFLNKTDMVLAPSQYIYHQLKKKGIKTKIQVLPMWIEKMGKTKLDKVELKKKLMIPKDKKVILYFGRLDKDKNLILLIKAIKILNNRLDKEYKEKFMLIMAGKGCYQKKLAKIVLKNKISHLVRFIGYVPYQKQGQLFKIADVFVITSLFEAQSLGTLQAIFHQLPVIAADHGALKEISDQFPKLCLSFNPRKVTDLVSKIMTFIVNKPKKINKLPKTFLKKYSKNTIINQLEKIYEQK